MNREPDGMTTPDEDMRRAVEDGTHEGLNDLEYAFLVELAREGKAERAAACVGIGGEVMRSLLRKLEGMDLLEVTDGTARMLPELRDVLLQDPRNGKTMSILGKPKVAEFYRRLKREYGFVYPEIPLAAFIREAAVKECLGRKEDCWYFLTARVDFLVCDRDGFPRLAFEYQGGGHDTPEKRKKDALKRKLLEAADIPLREVGPGVAQALPPVNEDESSPARSLVSDWGKSSPARRYESYLSAIQGEPIEPEYPTNWNHLKKEYVAVLGFQGETVERRLLGKRVGMTRDGRSAGLEFKADEMPDALPVGTTLEIRDGSHKHLLTSYFRKDAGGWRLLKQKEGASALFQKGEAASDTPTPYQ